MTEARELHRLISAIQASAGPVTDQALEQIIFRASHEVVQSLMPRSGPERVALLPSVVRILLATFLEDVAGAADRPEGHS